MKIAQVKVHVYLVSVIMQLMDFHLKADVLTGRYYETNYKIRVCI